VLEYPLTILEEAPIRSKTLYTDGHSAWTLHKGGIHLQCSTEHCVDTSLGHYTREAGHSHKEAGLLLEWTSLAGSQTAHLVFY
jgi:hypothetical protein